jgi:cystathionine beta-lyase/cystathionine gamma-synthase
MASGGATIAFEVAGGAEAAVAFCDRLRLARLALSLGGPETLVSHPATTMAAMTPAERAARGVTDGLLRCSVGLEDPADLEADLLGALSGLER